MKCASEWLGNVESLHAVVKPSNDNLNVLFKTNKQWTLVGTKFLSISELYRDDFQRAPYLFNV